MPWRASPTARASPAKFSWMPAETMPGSTSIEWNPFGRNVGIPISPLSTSAIGGTAGWVSKSTTFVVLESGPAARVRADRLKDLGADLARDFPPQLRQLGRLLRVRLRLTEHEAERREVIDLERGADAVHELGRADREAAEGRLVLVHDQDLRRAVTDVDHDASGLEEPLARAEILERDGAEDDTVHGEPRDFELAEALGDDRLLDRVDRRDHVAVRADRHDPAIPVHVFERIRDLLLRLVLEQAVEVLVARLRDGHGPVERRLAAERREDQAVLHVVVTEEGVERPLLRVVPAERLEILDVLGEVDDLPRFRAHLAVRKKRELHGLQRDRRQIDSPGWDVRHRAPIVTRRRADYEGTGLPEQPEDELQILPGLELLSRRTEQVRGVVRDDDPGAVRLVDLPAQLPDRRRDAQQVARGVRPERADDFWLDQRDLPVEIRQALGHLVRLRLAVVRAAGTSGCSR